MTIVNLDYCTTQLCKIKSTDTISDVCLEISAEILEYISKHVLKENPVARDGIDTCNIMIRWYIGLLTRACVADINYEGSPSVQMLYFDKPLAGQTHLLKHAFTFQSLGRVPAKLLTEFVCKIVISTTECIITRNASLNQSQVTSYVSRLSDILDDLHRLMDIDPSEPKNDLGLVMIRYIIPNDLRIVLDYC